jgi:hypothetical protein
MARTRPDTGGSDFKGQSMWKSSLYTSALVAMQMVGTCQKELGREDYLAYHVCQQNSMFAGPTTAVDCPGTSRQDCLATNTGATTKMGLRRAPVTRDQRMTAV